MPSRGESPTSKQILNARKLNIISKTQGDLDEIMSLESDQDSLFSREAALAAGAASDDQDLDQFVS